MSSSLEKVKERYVEFIFYFEESEVWINNLILFERVLGEAIFLGVVSI